jgi:hypothetical protein
VLIFRVLLLIGSLGSGVLLALENRDVVVQARAGHVVWAGHLYTALVVGALLACWFMLGVAFIRCRLAERRRRAASRSAVRSRPPAQRLADPSPRRLGAGRSISATKAPIAPARTDAYPSTVPSTATSTALTTQRVAEQRGR